MASSALSKDYKLWPFRCGVRTPVIVSWPDQVRRHRLREQFVDVIDITPTVLDYLGSEAPEPLMPSARCRCTAKA